VKTSDRVEAIQSAIIKASDCIKNLLPSAEGYGYNYIPLEKVIDELKGILSAFGLYYIQLPSGGGVDTIGLCTRIIHTSGEWIEDTAIFPITDMKGVNKSQAAGAAITYFRRYALCSAFGITGDKDVDAVVPRIDPLALYTVANIMSNIKQHVETKDALGAQVFTDLEVDAYRARIKTLKGNDDPIEYKAELFAMDGEIVAEIKARSDTHAPAFQGGNR